jgi:hypothetical protein
MSKQTDKRRRILSESEINELYCLPRFNNIQREQSFSLPDEELKAVNQQSSLSSKAYFILLLGYFREKPLIAQFRFRDVQDDLKYVVNRYWLRSSARSISISWCCAGIVQRLVLSLRVVFGRGPFSDKPVSFQRAIVNLCPIARRRP